MASTRAVILAGGRGTRLAPYTSVLPKPLMPVGERAILEHVVAQLEWCGIVDITLCVGYLSHLIRAVFDTRVNGHVSITYAHETEALGTAGPLRQVEGLGETFLVMNGDVLTDLDYRKLIAHHREHGNLLTIGTRERIIKVDYGVIHLDAALNGARRVNSYEEKPEVTSTVSMGVYVVEPRALRYIPENGYFDFPDLVQALLAAEEPVGAYLHDGLWFDIGRADDYERAVRIWETAHQTQEREERSTTPAGTSHSRAATVPLRPPVSPGKRSRSKNVTEAP